jgi:hypothetical protein
MVSRAPLKIPKKLKQVTLRVHPDGTVIGSFFLSHHRKRTSGAEEPIDVLNQSHPFVVVQREEPDELRFYNKASIVRVEYDEEFSPQLDNITPLYCRLHMMDGSLIDGCIRRPLPPDHARLSDYLNLTEERFIKMHTKGGQLWLVNKSYIVYVTPLDEQMQPSLSDVDGDA